MKNGFKITKAFMINKFISKMKKYQNQNNKISNLILKMNNHKIINNN